ncbi:MAG: hypothetical protein ACPGQD_04245, partial [Planctomycetota bacterium]
MLTPLLLYLAFFTVLHVVAQGAITRHYHRAFKISRGVAAGILTIIGFTALAFSLDHWRDAFLFAQDYRDGGRDFWMWHGLLIVLAHMLSDFLWMAWGKWRYDITPRKDLMLHHGLGIVG